MSRAFILHIDKVSKLFFLHSPRSLPTKTIADQTAILTVEEGDLVEMQRAEIKQQAAKIDAKNRKENKLDKSTFDKTIKQGTEKWSREKLMTANMARWQEAKQKQIDETRDFEQKHFAANLELLLSLQKGNEEE